MLDNLLPKKMTFCVFKVQWLDFAGEVDKKAKLLTSVFQDFLYWNYSYQFTFDWVINKTKSWVAFFETQCTCCVATHFRQGSRFTFSFFTCFFLNATVDCYQFFSHELWLPTIYLLTSFVTTAYLLCHVTYVCFGGTDFPFIFEIIDPQFICLLGSSSAFTTKRTWVLHKNSI